METERFRLSVTVLKDIRVVIGEFVLVRSGAVNVQVISLNNKVYMVFIKVVKSEAFLLIASQRCGCSVLVPVVRETMVTTP
jgi:hypothetical protein